ncbi:MarR family winged helix-turn-helix transcriptional regulator [Tannockella kyphosi]|uniref:MarR family winged helix-turn-helix transcriptional regulator n=1 Tax=Tannockella kyphosi TaxID=2899121 RepID=UPI0020123234|nr:MarR family transcriptional regulator [Tannockella kyphosi]
MSNHDENQRQIINELLVTLFNEILDIEEDYLQEHGVKNLTVTEIHMLETIESIENPTMSSLAKKATLTNGTVTTAIKKLEEKKCVQRIKDERDRRIMRVILTEKGKKAIAIHTKFHQEMIDSICSDTSSLEDKHLIDSLRNLTVFFKGFKEKNKS